MNVKILIYGLSALIACFGGYAAGVYQVSNRPVEIKTECNCDADKILESINQQLKDLQKANGLQIEKLKGFKGNFNNYQNYHIEMNGDSLILQKIESMITASKIVRCK